MKYSLGENSRSFGVKIAKYSKEIRTVGQHILDGPIQLLKGQDSRL